MMFMYKLPLLKEVRELAQRSMCTEGGCLHIHLIINVL